MNNKNEKTNNSILWVDEVLDSEDSGPHEIPSSEEDLYYDRIFSNITTPVGFTNLWDFWNEESETESSSWGSGDTLSDKDSWSYDSDNDCKMG